MATPPQPSSEPTSESDHAPGSVADEVLDGDGAAPALRAARPSPGQRAAALSGGRESRSPGPVVNGPNPTPDEVAPAATGLERPSGRSSGLAGVRSRPEPRRAAGPASKGSGKGVRRRLHLGGATYPSLLVIGGLLVGLGLGATGVSSSFPFSGRQQSRETQSNGVTDGSTAPPATLATTPTIPGPAPTLPAAAGTGPGPAGQPPPQPNWIPRRIRVPKIKVDAPIDPLGVDDKNTLQVPSDPARVGWWSGGAQPGQPDPAVLVGHRDSSTGAAVFFRLGELVPGDVIELDRTDGSTARFMVDHLESHPKTEFPTQAVYGATDSSTLRLITCFGAFDKVQRSYKDNLVIYANLMP